MAARMAEFEARVNILQTEKEAFDIETIQASLVDVMGSMLSAAEEFTLNAKSTNSLLERAIVCPTSQSDELPRGCIAR